ncbi:MAG: DUF1553 domain-containing protein, partial [Verrucomicrobia bacterium]|nr:DUF1553 domain-containing protein [Verrucomicrobiota bacterium]
PPSKQDQSLQAPPNQRPKLEKDLQAARASLEKLTKSLPLPPPKFTPLLASSSLRSPTRFLDSPKDDPSIPFPSQSSGRRSALADWITDPRHPLTARVAVNHLWTRHFGTPLVPNLFDFGRKNPPPVQLDLLNWLASELIDSGYISATSTASSSTPPPIASPPPTPSPPPIPKTSTGPDAPPSASNPKPSAIPSSPSPTPSTSPSAAHPSPLPNKTNPSAEASTFSTPIINKISSSPLSIIPPSKNATDANKALSPNKLSPSPIAASPKKPPPKSPSNSPTQMTPLSSPMPSASSSASPPTPPNSPPPSPPSTPGIISQPPPLNPPDPPSSPPSSIITISSLSDDSSHSPSLPSHFPRRSRHGLHRPRPRFHPPPRRPCRVHHPLPP